MPNNIPEHYGAGNPRGAKLGNPCTRAFPGDSRDNDTLQMYTRCRMDLEKEPPQTVYTRYRVCFEDELPDEEVP